LQLSGTTYYNATFYSGLSILMCDVNGTGVSGTPHYGTWTISSASPNYAYDLTFWSDSGSSWIETSTFYPGASLRVNASFRDESNNTPSTSGTGTLTFYDAEEHQMYNESDGAIGADGVHTYQNGTTPSNITIQPTWIAGPVTAIASWNNGTSVGEVRKQYAIYHHTELELEFPVYQAFRGDTVTIRVKYVDSETGLGIPGASLYFNWTYEAGEMGYAGNGWYAGYVDASIAVIGSYLVTTNASKPYHDYVQTTGITIEIQERTVLYSPKNLGTPTTDYEIAWGNSKTIYIAYEDSIAMNPTSLTATIGSPSSPDETDAYTSNNVYASVSSVGNTISLIIETNASLYDFAPADLTALTFKLEGKFSTSVNYGEVFVYDFTSSSWISIIDSYSQTSDTTRSWKTTSPADFISGTGLIKAMINATHTSGFDYDLDLFDFIANRPIDDLTPDILVTTNWPSQTTVGTQTGPIYNMTLRIWQVTFNTKDVTPGAYTILIEASASGHQSKDLELTVTVRAHHTRVSASPPTATPWSWKTNITIRFSDTDNASVIIGENNITSIKVDSTYGVQTFESGSWVYDDGSGVATISFCLDTSSWDVGSYSVTITVTTSGTGASKHFDDESVDLDIVVRSHDISVSVSPPRETPWSWKTNVSITLTDLDNSSLEVDPLNITQIAVAGQVFTSSDWTYSSGVFSLVVDTSGWDTSSIIYDVYISTTDFPEYYDDASGKVRITIRSHILVASASTQSATPWSWKTSLTIALTDLDNSTLSVPPGNVSRIEIAGQVFTSDNWTYSETDRVFIILVDTSYWAIGKEKHTVTVVTTSSPRFYDNAETSVSIEIRAHYISLSISPPSATPWSWTTEVVVTITDLDNSSLLVTPANISQIVIAGVTFTSTNWTHSGDSFTCVVDTSGWVIGSGTYDVNAITNSTPTKMYSDSGSTVSIRIVSHAITVEAIRPLATPWSENTTIEIRITDVDNASIIIQSSNVTNIKIGSQVFTSWIWDNGCFTVVVDTDDWAIGSASYGVEITTNGTGTTKYFADRSSSVVIEIRNRYSEAYAPSPDPVPYLDNLTFYIEFGDRDSSGALVDLTKIYLNDSSLIENTDYWVVRVSEGYYQVTMVTTSLTIGNHQVVVTCEHTNYENATTTVRFRVRLTETEAVASGYRFDVPLGTNITFTIEYNDIDHNQGIAGATLVNNGTLESTNVYNGNGVYEVKIITWDNTALDTYTIRFNLTQTNFEDAHVIVIITVEMHSTYLSFDEPVVPTGIASNITVYLFYEDMSLNTGISNSTGNITVCLTNDINPSTTFTVQNNTGLGVGHYLILIPADQFGGLYNVNFTVYFNWTNVPKYANLTRTFSVQLQGTPTDLSVYIAPEAIYYNNWVNFTLLYKNSENNVGVGNSSGNVWVSAEVTTAGQSVSPSAFQITWIDNGHYRFLLNSSHFTSYGSFVIKTCFGWNQTASPYYENQTLSITVTILVRTTLLDVTPPQNTAFDENATFTFTYYDSPSNSAIANSTNMEVQLDNAGVEYWLSYNSGDCVWTVIVNTTSIGSIGPIDLILKVTWGGAPFYQNQTKTVVLQVTARPTQLTYSAPIPTFFNSNLTVVFTLMAMEPTLSLSTPQRFQDLAPIQFKRQCSIRVHDTRAMLM
jgi:hypothetical protein